MILQINWYIFGAFKCCEVTEKLCISLAIVVPLLDDGHFQNYTSMQEIMRAMHNVFV